MTGLTTAATLFVVASVGMAAGGGLYLTACFATVMILIALVVLGSLEHTFALKSLIITYEVTGRNVDGMLREVNRILDTEQLTMQSVHIASAAPDFRMVFAGRLRARTAECVLHTPSRVDRIQHGDSPRNYGTRMSAPPSGSRTVRESLSRKLSACGNDFLIVEVLTLLEI